MTSPEELDKKMEAFVRDHAAALQGYLRARFRLSDDLTGEVMNDAFLVIAVKMRRGEEPTKPRPYLLEVAKNAAIKRLREKFRRFETTDPQATEDSADSINRIAELIRSEDLRRLVRKLPSRQRQVIELLYLDDCSVADTVAILGISQSAVYSNTFAALGRLRQIIAEEGETWDWDF